MSLKVISEKKAPFILLLGILCLYLVIFYFQLLGGGTLNTQYGENRSYAKWPKIELDSSEHRKIFFEKLGIAASDRFGLRAPFYLAIRTLRFQVFGMPASDYLITKDGYFLNISSVQNQFIATPTPAVFMEPFKRNLRERLKQYKEKNIHFNFILAPTKEFYIIDRKDINPSQEKPAQGFTAEISTEFPGVFLNIHSLAEHVRKENKNFPLTYKTDSHWSYDFAHVVVKGLIKNEYNEDLPTNKLIPREQLKFGDIARYLGIYQTEWIRYDAPIQQMGDLPYIEDTPFTGLKSGEKIRAATYSTSATTKSVLVYGDSMADVLADNLGLYFRHVFYIKYGVGRERADTFKRDFISIAEQLKVSHVVYCLNERFFPPQADPEQTYDPDLFF